MAFVLGTGDTFLNKNDYSDRKYLRVLVKRVKEDGTVLHCSSEYLEKGTDKLVEEKVRLMNWESNETYETDTTYTLATNENYKEYPEIEDYLDGGFSSRASYYHKAEVTFQVEKWRKRIYLDWKGNLSLLDFIEDLKDTLEDGLEDKKFKDQGMSFTESETIEIGMYTEDGAWVDTELDLDELLQAVVNVRVVEFREDELQS